MLGVLHCPAGGHADHLRKLCKGVDTWIVQMQNAHLPPALVWKSYHIQLWARLKYALGTLTNSLEATDTCLQKVDYTLLPLLNINRHIQKGWRWLHQSFGGSSDRAAHLQAESNTAALRKTNPAREESVMLSPLATTTTRPPLQPSPS